TRRTGILHVVQGPACLRPTGVSMRAVHGESVARSVKVIPDGETRDRRLTVWDTAGPVGAPTLVLLHGVTLDAETNWSGCIPALARHFRVLSLDLRGHGEGLPARVPYRLDDCADDVAAAVRVLRVGPVIPVGYSMG